MLSIGAISASDINDTSLTSPQSGDSISTDIDDIIDENILEDNSQKVNVDDLSEDNVISESGSDGNILKDNLKDSEDSANAVGADADLVGASGAGIAGVSDDDFVGASDADIVGDSSDASASSGDSVSGSDSTAAAALSPVSSVISASSVKTSYNSGKYLTITLKDSSNNLLAYKTVKIVINGKSYTKTTNSNGIAKLLIKLAPGTYTAKFTFAGDSSYKSATNSAKIKITKAKPKLVAKSKTFKRSIKTKKYAVILKNNKGVVLKNKRLTLKVNGKTYKAKTNSKGKAIFKITKLNKNGKFKAIVRYAGNAYYKAIKKSVKIIVKTKVSSTSTSTSTSTSAQGQLLVNGKTVSRSKKTYSVSSSNKNTVLVKNGGKLTLKNSKIIKKGDVSNADSESSDFYGTNAAVLVTANSKAYITNCNITTNAKGANAIFVSNLKSSASGATAYVSNVVINTYKDKSRGLDATFGGKIIANNVTIYTRGGSCAAVATDRGEGIITVTDSKLYTGVGQTSGSGSPLIYSTGDISVSNSKGTSYVSQIACIEGKNSITLNNCDFIGYAKGNRYANGEYVDLGGIFIYQSMSGDADVGTSQFTATNSKLSISSSSAYYKKAPMFHVTNTKAAITLDACTLNYGSGVLLNASGQNQWGKTGSNGGEVTFNANNMALDGDIVVDKISTLKLTLTNTQYNGAINPSSSYGTTNVVVNSQSTWTLTGNSHVSSLSNAGTINYGSYTLYVNGVAYNANNPYK